jgi:TetR/AcrR family transcriptional regulator, regulator of autoinduction and epiphytic fitness
MSVSPEQPDRDPQAVSRHPSPAPSVGPFASLNAPPTSRRATRAAHPRAADREPESRGERTKRRLAEALLSLIEEGEPIPTAAAVAARASVSVRLVFHHFQDMEALFREMITVQTARHWSTVAPVPAGLALEARIDRTVRQRAKLFEAITPVRWAGVVRAGFSPDIAAGLAASDLQLRRWLEQTFAPELAAAGATRRRLLDAMDAAASWEAWYRLRRAQHLSVSAGREVMARTLRALLPGQDG